MKIENAIITDIFDVFNATLNNNAQNALKRTINHKLQSVIAVKNQQQIIKCFLANFNLFANYNYPILHYREVFFMIEQSNFGSILEQPNPLKTLKSDKKFQQIKGKATQLIIFLHYYFTNYLKDFKSDDFPNDYKNQFNGFTAYFKSYDLDFYQDKIRSKKLNADDVFTIIQIFQEHYTKGKQFPFIDFFAQFEAYVSIAKQSIKHQFKFPDITENNIVLTDFYHPKVKNAITNSFDNSNGVLLLTGANMAGKSTFLKSLGMCVYLAHLGFPVPAKEARIPFYNEIYIFINNNDDLSSGYSYFMQEVLNLKEVVLKCNDKQSCFALFDELFKGTNFEDALEISTTTLKGLLKFKNSFFAISSHIHQLKDRINNENEIHTYYLECLIENKKPLFTYKLKKGFSDLKLGKIIFENEKLNDLLQ